MLISNRFTIVSICINSNMNIVYSNMTVPWRDAAEHRPPHETPRRHLGGITPNLPTNIILTKIA